MKECISVIVPVYKVEEYLDRCVMSIVNQTYTNLEIILVDDGSPDHCPDMCDVWAEKDERIKVIHKENGGLSDARNAGFAEASGSYISFIDSDDWISSAFYEQLYTVMQKENADIVECNAYKTETEENLPEVSKTYNAAVYDAEDALRLLITDNTFHQYVWNKLYKRSVIRDVLFAKGRLHEDEFWTYQIFGNSCRVAKLDSNLYYYFQRPSSIMGQQYSIKRLDALAAKLQRQVYIEKKYPQLSSIAKSNLFFSCMYQGQLVLDNLHGSEKNKAVRIINRILKKCRINKNDLKLATIKHRVWLISGTIGFWCTCRIRRWLRIGY